MLNPQDIECVVYHYPCADGAGSAFAAWKFFQNNFPDRQPEFFPMTIGAAPPKGLNGKNVLICDYSYRKNVIDDLIKRVKGLLIIDHHKTAEKDLEDLGDDYKIFDMTQSGAMLTWKYFFPTTEPPLLVKYIQDRDLWKKQLEGSDDFASWFFTLPFNKPELYSEYLDDSYLLESIKTKGAAFRELNDYNIERAVDSVAIKFCKIHDKYYLVGYVNSTILKSDIGNKIFSKYPLLDFTAVYSINDHSDSTSFSLRSTALRSDVSEIAFKFGGGGHRCASGVKIGCVTNHLPGRVYDFDVYSLVQNLYYSTITVDNSIYNIVYLQSGSSDHAKKLGEYLLQEKTVCQRVCQCVSYHLGKEQPDEVHLAAVWTYNIKNDTTKFYLSTIDSVKELQEEYEFGGLRTAIPIALESE